MSQPVAWLIEVRFDDGEIMHRYIRFDHAAIPRLQSLAQFTVTPLVAATPQQSVEQVREMLRDFASAVAGQESADTEAGAALCVAEADALESSLLSLLTGGAAPPEGAPTWRELADTLRTVVVTELGDGSLLCVECGAALRREGHYSGCRAGALLSRIPKEHAPTSKERHRV